MRESSRGLRPRARAARRARARSELTSTRRSTCSNRRSTSRFISSIAAKRSSTVPPPRRVLTGPPAAAPGVAATRLTTSSWNVGRAAASCARHARAVSRSWAGHPLSTSAKSGCSRLTQTFIITCWFSQPSYGSLRDMTSYTTQPKAHTSDASL